MRLWFVGFVSCAAMLGAAMASPAVSNELMLPLAGKAANYAPLVDRGGSLPSVARGQALGVVCSDVREAGAVVQVVLQIARAMGGTATGYSAVLATEQNVTDGTVHVRVPDVPGIAQHTVNVKVYVTGSKGTHSCDGGLVRIV
jgi:hypothetical protein